MLNTPVFEGKMNDGVTLDNDNRYLATDDCLISNFDPFYDSRIPPHPHPPHCFRREFLLALSQSQVKDILLLVK